MLLDLQQEFPNGLDCQQNSDHTGLSLDMTIELMQELAESGYLDIEKYSNDPGYFCDLVLDTTDKLQQGMQEALYQQSICDAREVE